MLDRNKKYIGIFVAETQIIVQIDISPRPSARSPKCPGIPRIGSGANADAIGQCRHAQSIQQQRSGPTSASAARRWNAFALQWKPLAGLVEAKVILFIEESFYRMKVI